jgi:hypothetical protein
VGRGLSATSVAALAVAALLVGCGGGQKAKPSAGGAHERSAASSTATPSATAPATTATTTATRTATTPTPPPVAAYWPFEKLVARLAGRTLALPRGPVRLDGALLECNGEGTPARTTRPAGWSRYTCTQMFGPGGDQDVTFDVVIESATQMRIVSPRYGAQ